MRVPTYLQVLREYLDADLSVRREALRMEVSEILVERRIASCALETLGRRLRFDIECLGGLAGDW